MAEEQRATFSYRDPRSTRLLNNSNKDERGWQRPHSLFGFQWELSSGDRNRITIGPGAIHTFEGVKIFFNEDTPFSLQIDPSGIMAESDFPYPKIFIVAIEHSYVAATSDNPPILRLIELRHSQEDIQPALYIQEVDMVDGTTLDGGQLLRDFDRFPINSPGYNQLYEESPGGAGVIDPTTKANWQIGNSILYNMTPILKVVISKVNDGGEVVPEFLADTNGNPSPGVTILRYKNLFDQVNDMLGVNIFEPVTEDVANNGPDFAYGMTSQDQTYDKSNATLPQSPMAHPLYGLFDGTTSNYRAYRFSNYLLDGRPLLYSLQRLDAFLRLTLNKLGEQNITRYNDEAEFKDLTDLINLGKVSVGDPIVWNSGEKAIKSGDIYHDNTSPDGDDHNQAISFLDRAVEFIVNRLGMTSDMTRSLLEAGTLDTTEEWSVSNPPGRDWTANSKFHAAIQHLRDNFASRGNETITGSYFFSSNEADRDTEPAGQRVVVTPLSVSVTDDTDTSYIAKDSVRVSRGGNYAQVHRDAITIVDGSGNSITLNKNGVLGIQSGGQSVNLGNVAGNGYLQSPATLSGASTQIVRGDQLYSEQQARIAGDNALSTAIADAIAELAVENKIFGFGAPGPVANPTFPSVGVYDFEDLAIDTAVTLPWFTIIRCTGNLTISAAITVSQRPIGSEAEDVLLFGQSLIRSYDGSFRHPYEGGGAGGSSLGLSGTLQGRGGWPQGSGGPSLTETVESVPQILPWRNLPIVMTGHGRAGDDPGGGARNGGGIIVLLVRGDLNMSGGSITAVGTCDNAASSGAESNNGGGAGGFLGVHCNGTWTNGTITLNGAEGGNAGGMDDDGGGGAGGVSIIRVNNTSGTITINARGGDRGGDSGRGGSGGTHYLVYSAAGANSAFTWDLTKGINGDAGINVDGSHIDTQFDVDELKMLPMAYFS